MGLGLSRISPSPSGSKGLANALRAGRRSSRKARLRLKRRNQVSKRNSLARMRKDKRRENQLLAKQRRKKRKMKEEEDLPLDDTSLNLDELAPVGNQGLSQGSPWGLQSWGNPFNGQTSRDPYGGMVGAKIPGYLGNYGMGFNRFGGGY